MPASDTNESFIRQTALIVIFVVLIALGGYHQGFFSSFSTGDSRTKLNEAASETSLSGSNRASLIWSADKYLYEDLILNQGDVLLIEPGVTVYLAAGVNLNIKGKLVANGTPSSVITFTALQQGTNWGSIFFDQGNAQPGTEKSKMSNCIITDAESAIRCNFTSPIVMNTTIIDSAHYDFHLESASYVECLHTVFDRDKIFFGDAGSNLSVKWLLDVSISPPPDHTDSDVNVVIEDLKGRNCFRGVTRTPGSLEGIKLEECQYVPGESFQAKRLRSTSHRIIAYDNYSIVKQHRVYVNSSKLINISFDAHASTEKMISEVNKENLVAIVHDLTDFGTRHTITPEKYEAARYLYDRFTELGSESLKGSKFHGINSNSLTVEYDNYTHLNYELDDKRIVDLYVVNVVATLPGTDINSDQEYIISAHYDSHNLTTCPGADDDASGISAMMEAARIMSQYRFPHTIKFIAFDAEEEGYRGSGDYAWYAKLRGDNITCDIQLDMIGFNNDSEYANVIRSNGSSMWLANSLSNSNSKYGLGLNVSVHNNASYRRSDHFRFWDRGYDAVLVSENEDINNWNPYYHKSTDRIDIINFTQIQKTTQMVIAALADLVGISNTPPSSPGNIRPTVTHSLRPQLTWSPSVDLDSDDIEYQLSIGTAEGKKDIVSNFTTRKLYYQIEGIDLVYGNTYYMEIYALDATGSSSDTIRHSFEVRNTPPVLSRIGSKTVDQDDLLWLNVTAVDTDTEPTDTLVFGEDFDGFEMITTTGEVKWRPSNNDVGVHLVNFSVTDGNGGTDFEVVTITVHNVNDPPVLFQNLPPITFHEDRTRENALDLDEYFKDIDGTALTYSYQGSPNIITTIHENGIVDLAAAANWSGTDKINFTATDPENATAKGSLSVTVKPVNDPPVITYIDEIIVDEGDTITLSPNASDVDGPFLKFSYSGAMTGNTWNTGYGDAGIYTVIVTVTDGELADHHVVNLVINNVNLPPVALSGRNRTVEVGEAVHLDASLSFDPDDDLSQTGSIGGSLSYLWEFGDGGTGNSKSVSHSYEKAGIYMVTLTVTDEDMASGTFTLTVTVTELDDDSGFPVFLAVILVVLFVTPIVLVIMISRRRRETEMSAMMWQRATKERRVQKNKKIKRIIVRKTAAGGEVDGKKPENDQT